MRIYIPSFRREVVKTTAALTDLPVTLVLRAGEPAPQVLGNPKLTVQRLPKAVQTLSATRRAIGRLAATAGDSHFLMMDDDLKLFERVWYDSNGNPLTTPKLANLTKPKAMLSAVTKTLKLAPSVSISARFGNNFVQEDYKFNGRQTQATAYKTDVYNKLTFGVSEYFEDTARTIQLFLAGHRNVILFSYAMEPGRMNTPGGCSTWRTWDGMKADSEAMAARYPGIVQSILHPDPYFFPEHGTRPEVKPNWRRARQQGGVV